MLLLSTFCLIFLLFLHHVFIIVYFRNDDELRLRRSQGKVRRGLICIQILMKSRMRKLSPDFRKKANESLCFANTNKKRFTLFDIALMFSLSIDCDYTTLPVRRSSPYEDPQELMYEGIFPGRDQYYCSLFLWVCCPGSTRRLNREVNICCFLRSPGSNL